MPQSDEPSVEDILQSIKEVMTRGGPAAVPSAGLTDPADGVLELTDVIEHDDPTWPQARAEPVAATAEEAPLVASERQASMRESLQALAVLAQPGTAAQIARTAEASLDGLTRELLRPMLAEWLDRNLPPMVERLVKAEIARIAGQPG